MAWYAHHWLVASETALGDTQLEGPFPLADGGHTLGPLAGSSCPTERRANPFWLVTAGGADISLFCMDVLDDLQHRIWGKGANGVVELVTSPVTLAPSALVLRWTAVRRAALGDR
jgi:hypothetical protein